MPIEGYEKGKLYKKTLENLLRKEGRKMKIIDLLNIWVEDRNKLPKKIKVDDETYIYDNQLDLYKIPKKNYFLISDYLDCIERIYTNVEVIEENKEIEELNKISYDEFKYAGDKRRFDLTNIEYDKINELVRAVNKLNKEREEK